MIVTFFDFEDDTNPFNGLAISEPERLAALLDSLRAREPFIARLVGENCHLDIGLGGDIGCVLFEARQPPLLMAVAAPVDRSNNEVEFMLGGTLSPVPARYILPFEKMKEIVVHFQRTGERSPMVSWEKGRW